VDGDPIVTDSARKHAVVDDDILHAYNHSIKVEELDDGLFMIVGPSRTGEMLEIGVVAGSESPVIVHAMQARPKYLR
jgi:hypothetical protein